MCEQKVESVVHGLELENTGIPSHLSIFTAVLLVKLTDREESAR